ncbi:uncharacterized protein LOC103573045 [Microplitis demolitor]|uniref:uncharacterized protein LOC103573045 n=1 Tax=Microplitis demolitor TaxID=69319 RepID=UPI0006D5061C|nr:uncharacterized protein LOC103573045 [Microplitis demolitor]
MKTEELSKQKDVLHQISQASDAIRQKHRMLKLGKDTAEKAMGEIFKPIVRPLQSVVESSEHKIKQEVNKELNDDNSMMINDTEFDDASNYDSIISEESSGTLKETQIFPAVSSTLAKPVSTDLLDTYNNTKHRTSKVKPADDTAANEKELLEKIYKPLQAQQQARKNKFKVGDKVRISKYKHVLKKGYTPNWTTEIFTIKTVQKTKPTTYKLVDYRDKPI